MRRLVIIVRWFMIIIGGLVAIFFAFIAFVAMVIFRLGIILGLIIVVRFVVAGLLVIGLSCAPNRVIVSTFIVVAVVVVRLGIIPGLIIAVRSVNPLRQTVPQTPRQR